MDRISPDELRAQGIELMLDGREPETLFQQTALMNYYAYVTPPTLALPYCRLMNRLYDMGLEEQEIEAVVLFQLNSKGVNPN